MARQANGTYIQPANTAAVSGQTISSTAFNTLITDVGTEITNSLDRQGRSAMQAALPMGNNKITGLATPTAATDAATKAYVDTVPLVDKSVTLQKLYHPTSTSKLLGSDAAAALSITAAVNNGSGLIRLTVASTATFATGQKKTVSDVVGTTEANGTWTITVVDGTHIDLQGSTFTNVYVSGGTIGGGIAEISLGAGLTISGQSLVSNPAGAWNYLSGLTMSTAGSSTTMNIAAGVASDTTNTTIMTLAAAINKTTASWAVGNNQGGLDTGSIANNSWYHFYLIQRPDTGVVDVLISLNGSSPPNLPTNYTLYRRIGAGRTNGSGQWISFTQFGDDFLWLNPTADIATATLSNGTTTFGLTVPTGVKVFAQISGFVQHASAGVAVLVTSPDQTNAGANGSTGNMTVRTQINSIGIPFVMTVRTNIFAQITAYADQPNTTFNVSTRGWTDLRGKI